MRTKLGMDTWYTCMFLFMIIYILTLTLAWRVVQEGQKGWILLHVAVYFVVVPKYFCYFWRILKSALNIINLLVQFTYIRKSWHWLQTEVEEGNNGSLCPLDICNRVWIYKVLPCFMNLNQKFLVNVFVLMFNSWSPKNL